MDMYEGSHCSSLLGSETQMKCSRLGCTLSLSYLALFLIVVLWALYLLVFHTATSEFCGLPAILITSPWSMILLPWFSKMGVIAWYEQFAGSPLVYGLCATGMLVPGALINAAIFYAVGFGWERTVHDGHA